MSGKTRVILDTDIGSDIDDAVALAYLLAQPSCLLEGITVVTGDVQKRAALCEMICRASGQADVPIHLGRRDVVAGGPGQPNVPQYDPVSSVRHRLDRPENTALDFLRQTIRDSPGEITLLTIGPLGNAAALALADPECFSLLKSWVAMAGRFYGPDKHEWNCISDPTATTITAGLNAPMSWVGLDVTLQCQMKAEEVRQRFSGPVLRLVLEMAEAWFSHTELLTFHDPLAAALVFQPGLCELEQGLVEAPLQPEEGSRGQTFFTPGDGPHLVARAVDRDAFFAEYFSRF